MQTDLFSAKMTATETGYISLVEIKLEDDITPDHFLRFFELLKTDAKSIYPD
jgi:hypothetical protein